MSAKNEPGSPRLTNDGIVQFVREHEEPCVTAGEIADFFDVTNGAVHYRLKDLVGEELRAKEVGASATVFYAVG